MSRTLRALRRRILTPDTAQTRLATRGFHRKDQAAQDLLETVGAQFLAGYGEAVEARTVDEAAARLDRIPARFRGFAYEGAAMGCAVLDALPFGGGRVAALLAGRGAAHVYMAYVGIGWALARLPKPVRPSVAGLDPLLKWLVLDGYGFHQAYFRTRRYVGEHVVDTTCPWPDEVRTGYAGRAIDQGIGRALWFVGGADPHRVAGLIEGFDPRRHPDLWGGAGLAATYAGGGDEAELTAFRDRAGEHRAILAQGSAFAAEARVRAGLLGPHTELATGVFCGRPAQEAARLTQETRPTAVHRGGPPAYEQWRQDIAAALVPSGRY